jgi:hypothetical protein
VVVAPPPPLPPVVLVVVVVGVVVVGVPPPAPPVTVVLASDVEPLTVQVVVCVPNEMIGGVADASAEVTAVSTLSPATQLIAPDANVAGTLIAVVLVNAGSLGVFGGVVIWLADVAPISWIFAVAVPSVSTMFSVSWTVVSRATGDVRTGFIVPGVTWIAPTGIVPPAAIVAGTVSVIGWVTAVVLAASAQLYDTDGAAAEADGAKTVTLNAVTATAPPKLAAWTVRLRRRLGLFELFTMGFLLSSTWIQVPGSPAHLRADVIDDGI